MTFIAEHSARNDMHVVNEPAPAISGKTSGTMVELPSGESFLKMVMLNVISIARAIRTTAPAMAKDGMSTLKNFNNASPMKRNTTNKPKASNDALPALIFPAFSLMSKIMGMEPTMSITANKTMNAVNTSLKSKLPKLI